MTDYTRLTNFLAKDNNNDIIQGADFQVEFDRVEVSSASKADLDSPTFTGTVIVPDSNLPTSAVNNNVLNSAIAPLNSDITNGLADRYTKTESDSRFVNSNGDSMSGDLLVNSIILDHSTNKITGLANPTSGNHAATKSYVDTTTANAVDGIIDDIGDVNPFPFGGQQRIQFPGGLKIVFDTVSVPRNTFNALTVNLPFNFGSGSSYVVMLSTDDSNADRTNAIFAHSKTQNSFVIGTAGFSPDASGDISYLVVGV